MSDQTARSGRVRHPRVPDDLDEALVAYAAAHDRSVQNAMIYLMRRGLEAEGAPASGAVQVRPAADDLHTR